MHVRIYDTPAPVIFWACVGGLNTRIRVNIPSVVCLSLADAAKTALPSLICNLEGPLHSKNRIGYYG